MDAKVRNMKTLMIQILQSKYTDLYVAEAAAEVIAADARFNLWVLSHMKKQGTSEERWMQLLDSCEEVHHQCEATVDAFVNSVANKNANNLAAVHVANETLRAGLLTTRQRLDSLRD
jgi:hypothetical protein